MSKKKSKPKKVLKNKSKDQEINSVNERPDQNRWVDILMLFLLPILSVVIAYSVPTNFLSSILLFFGLPAIWLALRSPEDVVKSAIFAGLVSLPCVLIAGSYAFFGNVWEVQSMFDFRILDIVALEQFLWGFLLLFDVVMFYEYFFDRGDVKIIDEKMKYFRYILLGFLVGFLIIFFTFPKFLEINYFYAVAGVLVFIVPMITLFSFVPSIIGKFIKTGAYFFVLFSMYELAALKFGWWSFPGDEYIGWVEVVGLRFPLEEFIFFMGLGAILVLIYYEVFDDDTK